MSLEPDEQELSRDFENLTAGMKERFARCPEPAVIQAARASVLPDGRSARIIAHVEDCPMCRLLVHDLELLDQAPLSEHDANRIWARIESGIALKGLSLQPRFIPTDPLNTGPTAAKWWMPFFRPWVVSAAAFAVIVLAIGISVGIRLMRAPKNNSEASGRLPQVSAGDNTTAAIPAQSIPSPSTSTAGAFLLEKAPVRLPASAAMVWRGGADADSDRASAQLKDLEQALVPYRSGNYAEAEARLKRVAEKYPRLAEARFYLGVSELFLNQDQDAAGSLKTTRSLADQALAAKAAWYLAVAYHRLGQGDQVRPILEKLCHSTGKDSARACAALGELSKVQ
jgi:TolA-binding protein